MRKAMFDMSSIKRDKKNRQKHNLSVRAQTRTSGKEIVRFSDSRSSSPFGLTNGVCRLFQSRFSLLVIIALLATSFSSCRFSMNFTGGNVDTSLETIFIDQVGNTASLVVPFVSQDMTTELQDIFLNRSRLSLATDNADVILSGNVTSYTVSPTAISGNETAAQNRLSISVSMMYENTKNPSESWPSPKNFSGFVDFSADADFASLEEELAGDAIEQIAQKVFNETLGKW